MRKAIFALIFAAALPPATQAAPTFELRSAANPELSVAIADGNVIEFALLAVTVPAKLPNYCTVSATGRAGCGRARPIGQVSPSRSTFRAPNTA